MLLRAFKLGYYDIPRKIESEELAIDFGIAKSTLSDHLRKSGEADQNGTSFRIIAIIVHALVSS